jgi:hypothetical protein
MASQSIVESAMQTMDLDINIVARTSKLINGLLVTGKREDVEQLASNYEVKQILPLYDSELHVAASADYIKATPLVEAGIATGASVKVAVLDTGIDYTHAQFGGEGTPEAYAAAAADTTDAVAWPQGQVHGGYDFVRMDPDPIDFGTSHGTHVSHSVTGIAPDVELYAYSVCNSGCPGLAQFQAIEAAMDPNGDGNISDRVDVINMSLGGSYGDVASGAVGYALNEAVKLGTSVIISAGNDGAYPFVVGGPSTTENALSVGAMTHPTTTSGIASGSINGEEAIIQGASFGAQEFAHTSDEFPIVYPDANQLGCEAFGADVDFTGKAVVIDRGACAFVTKALTAQANGAALVFIANSNDDGTPAPMGGSSADVTIPAVGITYQAGLALKESGIYSVSVEQVSTPGAIASFTSRGPSMDGLLKPEITAPGVAIMTATPGGGMSPISGTSFSGPITAGAISMLKEALPERNAFERKATLMNTANLDVTMEARTLNPDAALAPISYIGAGLVDVEKAVNLPVAAWAQDTRQAALSFGIVNAAEVTTYTKTVEVKNFSSSAQTYTLNFTQRFADDMERGALTFDHPESITVPAGQTYAFDVSLIVDPAMLPAWTLDATNIHTAASTNDLTTVELDGALEFMVGDEKAFHLVYHMLPKANAMLETAPAPEPGIDATVATNMGAVPFVPNFLPVTAADSLDDSADSRLDIVGGAIESYAVDFCDAGFLTLATIVVKDGFSHTFMGGFMVDFDFDNDGRWDYTMQSIDYSLFGNNPAEQVSFTHPYGITSGGISVLYHTTGSNHVTLRTCGEGLGLTADDWGVTSANVRFRVEESFWDWSSTMSMDEVTSSYTFDQASVLAQLQSTDGTPLSSIAPLESAYLAISGEDFMVLSSGDGSAPMIASPVADVAMPPMLADAEFNIAENTATGSVVGQITAALGGDMFKNKIAEYIVVSQSSNVISLDKATGELTVADGSLLDYETGMTEVTMEVIAADVRGNLSESAMVTVMITDVNENPLPEPVVPERQDKSSGSFGWLALLAAPFAVLRRRKVK